jgi:hypothetical protein
MCRLYTERAVSMICAILCQPTNSLPLDFASNSTYDTLQGSNCTSCVVAQDLSNYCKSRLFHFLVVYLHCLAYEGFPKLYFHDPNNGTFTPVPDGGLLVYYQNRGTGDVSNGGTGLKAFPPGFKMISGSPTRRSKKYTVGEGSQAELAERAVEWECLRYTVTAGYNSANTCEHVSSFASPNAVLLCNSPRVPYDRLRGRYFIVNTKRSFAHRIL